MDTFLQAHRDSIHGVVSGFDRLRFRGTMRPLSFPKGVMQWFWVVKVLLKGFQAFVSGITSELKALAESLAKSTPIGKVVYVNSSEGKEDVVRRLMVTHGVPESYRGVVAVLSCVEPCQSFEVHSNRLLKLLELVSAFRKCLHYYVYVRHPEYGWMHLRLQTWLPMRVQIMMNGREWLACQLDRAGVAYRRLDNCFAWIADFTKAQELMNEQLATPWDAALSGLLQSVFPQFVAWRATREFPSYYWTTEQTEWATDVAFRSEAKLQAIYPSLAAYAQRVMTSESVVRFLQQRVTAKGEVPASFRGEVVTSVVKRTEGTCVKHRRNGNSVKMYDKFGVVLRVETTIHQAEDLKVFRPVKDNADAKTKTKRKTKAKLTDPTLAWQPLRRGIADLYRRCELSQASNVAYFTMLAETESPQRLGRVTAAVSQRRVVKSRPHRGLNVHAGDDQVWLRAIARGEYLIAGFRNADLRQAIFGDAQDATQRRQQSGQVTRRLQLLRAHGLIRKIPNSHRYKITAQGKTLTGAVSSLNEISLKTLHSLTLAA